ncbi:ABC-2 type transport system ATP-binding protein [Thermosyntropha lipolytica DSM 11003]|uniref:ABC-2 type transport system ATP-binding protein n=1 Tax=Thermosyntropha lipolytica DSM 11003 TaxID=1123382 RepID=A0A1M5S1G3_9FIRM|nr:ABC transporter ATP-binding protein [Thermosyntropha lipolytica]SHH32417.1 ABC-2 type transport system ATP-binding protein [Thermosyntropha lipolytica DSM 11003]
MAILEVENVSKDLGDFALRDISFKLDEGYIMGFIGPNGAGKTTTIKIIMNLMKKDKGKVRLFGLDYKGHELEIKNRIGFVFDENYYYEELTIKEMKKIIAPFYSNWDEDVFNDYIKKFSLPLNRKIKDLSKGMKMKFSLAVALSHNAELLVMDEPTSGLDPIVRDELLDILSEFIQNENRAVFFSTHITSDLDKIADYITFINEGRILFSSTKEELWDNYVLVKGDKALLDGKLKNSMVGFRENRFGFTGIGFYEKIMALELKDRLVLEKPTLEDIMLYFGRRGDNV